MWWIVAWNLAGCALAVLGLVLAVPAWEKRDTTAFYGGLLAAFLGLCLIAFVG